MMIVQKGSKVTVDYEGRFEDGTIFDSSHKHPGHMHYLDFKVGSGEVVPGFDRAVLGMKLNEEKEVTLEAKDAYGPYEEKLVHNIPRQHLPKDQEPAVGMVLLMSTPDGHQFPATIKSVSDKDVALDLNHPLAGKRLIFKIKIIAIA